MGFKSGFVAILGKPNVGKSTLLNTIIGEKVAIVSPKPQTTRNKILGILNEEDCQIIFIDTPGMHKSKNKLDEYMQKSIVSAKKDVDVVVLMIDGSKRFRNEDIELVKSFDKENVNTILVVSKIDETTFEKLYPQLTQFNELKNIKEIIPLSSFKNKNIQVLIDKIKEYLPDGVKYFDDDVYTDKSVKFIASEIIREKMLWLLQDEIPHGVAIDIVKFNEKKNIVEISADIVCEKQSHKQIIIGKNGTKIKEIGIKSRLDIEKLVDKQVDLKLFVKVREDWRDLNNYVKELGYDIKQGD